jgi:ubiquinone/menaquinone biosynthesis C-methylase UbiE
MKRDIITYYDDLAGRYDEDRFAGSYGRFVDAREREVLRAWLPQHKPRALELGCGTGRLSEFAAVATDASTASLALARKRNSSTIFVAADAEHLPFPEASFDAVFAFHVLMHLDMQAVRAIAAEASRVLRPGGLFIADIVSKTRRQLTGTRPDVQHAWHGAMALTKREFEQVARDAGFAPRRMSGLMLLPIHRLPDRARRPLAPLDAWVSSKLPSLSSYLIGCFAKR